jgi:hypothetical protein
LQGEDRILLPRNFENTFAKPKEFRATATRDDKTDGSFSASIHLAAAVIAPQ